jgi:hypothetical protein
MGWWWGRASGPNDIELIDRFTICTIAIVWCTHMRLRIGFSGA